MRATAVTTFPRRLAARALGTLEAAVFPPLCPLTREDTAVHGTLAPEAWAGLALLAGPRCRYCGRGMPTTLPGDDLFCDLCARMGRVWTRGAAAFRYEGTGRTLVLALKHGDRLDLAPMMARWMLGAAPDLVSGADLIAPVPLHWTRLLMRRANQSAELARHVAALAGKRAALAPRLLARTRRTPSQGGRDRAGRIANVADAFAPGAERDRLPGARVLLVDDVMTTGATLDASAAACLAGGAARVDVLVSALVIHEGQGHFGGAPRTDPDGGQSKDIEHADD